MIQCQGCTCAGWLWEGEGGLGDHQPGVYVPLKALFLVHTENTGLVYDCITSWSLLVYSRVLSLGSLCLPLKIEHIFWERTQSKVFELIRDIV